MIFTAISTTFLPNRCDHWFVAVPVNLVLLLRLTKVLLTPMPRPRHYPWKKPNAHVVNLPDNFLRKGISLITSMSDKGLASTCIDTVQGMNGRSTVAASQQNCFLTLPVQRSVHRSWQWIKGLLGWQIMLPTSGFRWRGFYRVVTGLTSDDDHILFHFNISPHPPLALTSHAPDQLSSQRSVHHNVCSTRRVEYANT